MPTVTRVKTILSVAFRPSMNAAQSPPLPRRDQCQKERPGVDKEEQSVRAIINIGIASANNHEIKPTTAPGVTMWFLHPQ